MADPERIADRLQALWSVAKGPRGGADRPAYSEAEARAIELVAGWAADAGLEPGIDDYGNLWALPGDWPGPILTAGSHVDTVPDGGRYDGALGTVLGLELALDLAKRAEAPVRAGVLVCAAEEAPRFGAGTLGSRLLIGALHESALDDLQDARGVTAAQARAGYLDALAPLPRVAPPLSRLRGHAEVHVAQRRSLRTLGIVTRVASPRRLRVRITGEAGHSGEVSMLERRDAMAAAAELVLSVEAAASAEPAETVATVGTLSVSPGSVSVIPDDVDLMVDMRGIAADSLTRLEAAIRAAVGDITGRRGVTAEVTLTRAGEPTELDPGLVDAALAAAARLGIPAAQTWSGAGHDAQHLTAIAPALLVFVPLHGGESHTPQEGANMDEILMAARLLTAVMGDTGRASARPVSHET
ncbi:MAG: hydantoinase/carbamoylase family amidase [Solirubrobacteraceae bacterium]